jgi:hypothetical protein
MNAWQKIKDVAGQRRAGAHLAVALVTLSVPLGGAVGAVAEAPGLPAQRTVTSALGVGGTTAADLASFTAQFNAVRKAHGLRVIPASHFRYDACMERRLFWMAEDPSTSPASAWGHIGSKRSDGVPSVGCDGNLAGGTNNTGRTVASKWWNSASHRTSLYKPGYTGSFTKVCIYFAMTHGGVPDEPVAFTRAAARWAPC